MKVRWMRRAVVVGIAALIPLMGTTNAGVAGASSSEGSSSQQHSSQQNESEGSNGHHGDSSSRWDKIVAGEWVVPTVNLQAYQVGADSNQRLLGAFENWYIFTIHNGQFSGPTQSVVSTEENGVWSPPSFLPPATMSGNISAYGLISMKITPTDPTIPVSYATGHMIFVSGQWRMTMQTILVLGAGIAPYVLQWANMTKLLPGQTVPGSPDFTDLGSMVNTGLSTDPLTSPQASWLFATGWAERDSQLYNGRQETFRINTYDNGYFFGTSTGTDPFSVTGTVAPDNSLYLVFTLPDGTIITRSGALVGLANGARMYFHSYFGTPAYGAAAYVPAQLRDQQYCEVIPTVVGTTTATSYIYNTIGYSECPSDLFAALTSDGINAAYGSAYNQRNGIRFWTMDNSLAIAGIATTGQTFTFGGLKMGLLGTLTTPAGQPTVGSSFYTPNLVDRSTIFTYYAGRPVFELVGPDGSVYVMQSYAQIKDRTLTYSQLPALGSMLTLPAGWSYRTLTLTKTLDLNSNGQATVVNDDLYNSYQKI